MSTPALAVAALFAFASIPGLAQEAEPASAAQPEPRPNQLYVPAPASRSTIWASAESVTTVDIPQWAKDEGHNGSAAYNATVGADGQLIALKLMSSSMSDAIDEAVRARAETLKYGPARDATGNPAQGYVNIRMSYAGFDEDSPGGGIDDYLCGNLVREYDWFTSVHNGQGPTFVPQLVYMTLDFWAHVANGEDVSDETIDKELAGRREKWPQFLDQCRLEPDARVLDVVDHPEIYREQVRRY